MCMYLYIYNNNIFRYKSFVATDLGDFCVFTLNGQEFLLSSGQTTQMMMQCDLLNLTCSGQES